MPAPLRVLCVIGSFHGFGAERQLLELLKHLDRSRFSPQLYLARKEGDLLTSLPEDVPVHAYRDPNHKSIVQLFRAVMKPARIFRRRHLREIIRRERIDVVLDRTYLATLDTAAAMRGLRNANGHLVPRISCAVAAPELGLEMYPGWSQSHTLQTAKRAYQSASMVVTNALGLRNRMIELFELDPAKVVNHYNLVDLARIDRESQAPLDWPHGDHFTLITAGRLSEEKGHADLIEAVNRLVHREQRHVRLVILGDGPLRDSLQQQLAASKLNDVVHLAGYCANPWPWFRRSQLFVLPSRSDAMPNALLEAVACHIPTIAADCPFGPREILDGGRVGQLVHPGDVESLTQAIVTEMNRSAADRELRVTAARDRLRQFFSLETGISRWEELIMNTACTNRGATCGVDQTA